MSVQQTELTDEEAIVLAVEGPEGFEGKAMPYLGWYWRDRSGRLSLYGDHVTLDPAGKWDYPSCGASPDDQAEILRLLAEMGRAKRRVLDILASYKSRMRDHPR